MAREKFTVVPDPSKDQHLMTNRRTVERIVESAGITRNDVVLEIGAGSGILTEQLARKGAKIIAVEIDCRFSKTLGNLGRGNVEIIYANALDVIDEIGFTKIVSNIPYSICEPLIRKLADREFELAVLSVPENFFGIISSLPGGKNYSLLSLKAGSFFSIEPKFTIPAGDFSPPPRTGSVAIVLRPLSTDDYRKEPWKFVCREILLQKRKKLGNALMEALINLNKKIFSRSFTKRLARKAIEKMHLPGKLLEKDVDSLRLEDFGRIRKVMLLGN